MQLPVHFCFAFLVCASALGQGPSSKSASDASLEELLDMQVTSVSKKEQKLSRTAAAVFIINAEDIARSGASNIPDLLRMVPGVNVARIDAHTWAISIRGPNNRFSDKVLVLIDGRSVYTPLTSGVNWDQQDVPLEDIERIEVLRGAGGTVWGANAVNGVINILTKSAQTTKGGLAVASGGDEAQHALIQYGAKVATGAYRVFGNYSNVENSSFPSSTPIKGFAADGSHTMHGGFRSDWTLSPHDNLTVQGDAFQLNAGQTLSTLFTNDLPVPKTLNEKVTAEGSNILGRWNRTLSNGSAFSLQVYYDRYKRQEDGAGEIRNTEDIDFHHNVRVGERHDIVWGLGYRITSDNIAPGYAESFTPSRRTDNLFNTFFQDEIQITDSLSVTMGSKFEHNGYTGFEFEPSAQVVWSPAARHEIWASAARAVRQPSRTDVDVHADLGTFPIAGGGFGVLRLTGDPTKAAEYLYDYGLGYRAQASKHISVDVATFFDHALGVETVEPGTPFFTATPTAQLIVPVTFGGKAHSETYGGEIFANWNVTNHWKVSPGYSIVHAAVTYDPGSHAVSARASSADLPRQEFQIRSFLSMPRGLNCDTSAFYVSSLPDDGTGSIPGYTRLDTQLTKRIGESMDFSIVGQNLLTPHHEEFRDSVGKFHTVVSRNIFVRIAWSF